MSSTGTSKRFRSRVAPEKRKRVAQACTTCRKLKRKCIPVPDSSCRKCFENELSCSFEEISTQQGVAEKESPEARQIKWEPLSSFHDDISAQMRRLHPELDLQPHHLNTLDQLFQFYQRRRIQHDQNAISAEDDQEASCERLNSSTDFLAKVSRTVIEASGQSSRGGIESGWFKVGNKDTDTEETTALATECFAHFPPQPRAIALTTIFFQGHQSNFYYCDQHRFKRRLTALYNHGLQSPLVTPAFVCLVAIAMAMGSQFEHLHSTSAGIERATETEQGHAALPGTKYLRLSQRLLPAALEARSVETVQSCLLTAFFLLATDDLGSYYTYTGLALRVAITLSLHRLKRNGEREPASASFEESKRLFWTVYCIERRSSMMVGRSETLPVEDITTPLPNWMMELDKYDIDRVDRLTAFINLTQIQTRVLKARSSEVSSHDLQQAQCLLEEWQRSLPACCQAYDLTALRSTIHLQIMYHMTWMRLGRMPLLAAVKSRLQKESDVLGSGKAPAQSSLLKLCTSSASAVIDLILELRDHGQIAFFSHLDLQSCSSAVTLLLLVRILDPDAASLDRLQEALAVLDLMSERSQYAKRGTQLVRQLYEVLNSPTPEGLMQSREGSAHPSEPTASHQLEGQLLHEMSEDHLSPDNSTGVDEMVAGRFDIEEGNAVSEGGSQFSGNDDALSLALGSEFESWLNSYSAPDLYFFGFDGLDSL
ncbi:fungal-specific transcription factor domain-containing protein [Dactylonectria estremocensis]|uniref:Fungal-specific transcription factor domain-containing protein n=1 Tax=Dactylonectria estremocensis TaxID=1079267 RepID=A0A9P9I9R1_9HYPO|nr:fungal-specific transcription factor domain-containing protein [Dactylonectria estremocensis]